MAVKLAVTNINSLFITHMAADTGLDHGALAAGVGVHLAARKGLREMHAWIDTTEEDVNGVITNLLSRIPRLKQRRHRASPTGRLKNHCIRVGLYHRCN